MNGSANQNKEHTESMKENHVPKSKEESILRRQWPSGGTVFRG